MVIMFGLLPLVGYLAGVVAQTWSLNYNSRRRCCPPDCCCRVPHAGAQAKTEVEDHKQVDP
jgi:hypothetical protein